jgi:hypothetical protein
MEKTKMTELNNKRSAYEKLQAEFYLEYSIIQSMKEFAIEKNFPLPSWDDGFDDIWICSKEAGRGVDVVASGAHIPDVNPDSNLSYIAIPTEIIEKVASLSDGDIFVALVNKETDKIIQIQTEFDDWEHGKNDISFLVMDEVGAKAGLSDILSKH